MIVLLVCAMIQVVASNSNQGGNDSTGSCIGMKGDKVYTYLLVQLN